MHEIIEGSGEIRTKYDARYLKNKLGDPQFFSLFETSQWISFYVRSVKKSLTLEHLVANVIKPKVNTYFINYVHHQYFSFTLLQHRCSI